MPSIKRCTCVNKRKNSVSRWMLENNITRCPSGSGQLKTGCQRENQLADWGLCGPQWPTVEQPKPRCERNAAMVEEELVSIQQSVLVSTHFSHTTNITLSKIKCEGFIFFKEVYSFGIEDVHYRLIMFPCIFIYVYVQLYYGYTTIHSYKHSRNTMKRVKKKFITASNNNVK